MGQCPICGTTGAGQLPPVPDAIGCDCPRCGQFYLSGSAAAVLPTLLAQKTINASLFSHVIRLRFDETNTARIWTNAELEPYKRDLAYLGAQEQFNNLILWIGRNQGPTHAWAGSSSPALAARVGTAVNPDNEAGLHWIYREFGPETYLRRSNPTGGSLVDYQLKAGGWRHFNDLSRQAVNSRDAFMAMKFNDPDLNKVLAEWFQPAADRAGFKLRALNERPEAGLIDNQIRAAIRSARFVIADLTHANQGAYFEAGFAEGLGLPVIYTCRRDIFDSSKSNEKPHFDANHMQTVVWDPANLAEAGKSLTATIRNTLPAEAKLDD